MPVPIYQAKAELFRTLGHPARIRILELLVERDRAVHELAEHIDIEASNLSAQLAVLRRAGLVAQRRVGHAAEYSISVPEVRDLLTAGRRILLEILDGQNVLRSALADEPASGAKQAAAAAGGVAGS
jgi:DNA-binding transcriptional ArsR family regulator